MQGKKLGALPEKRIMKLLKRGLGLHPVARRLGLSMYAVRSVAVKRNFRRKDGNGYRQPGADEKGFIRAVKRRSGYIHTLAKRFGIGQVRANALAHQILKTRYFRPGVAKPPLSSVFPQKHFGPRLKA